jgi:hypothetical protein
MKPSPIVAALIAALAFSTSLMAAEPDKRPGPPPRGPLFEAIDTDDDGTLSSGEIDGSTTSLRTLDENSDGRLTREELKIKRPPPPQDQEGAEGPPPDEQKPNEATDLPPPTDEEKPTERPPHPRHPAPPLMAALDTDHDGTLSSEELEAAPESLKALDENGDGELSEDELRPAPPEGAPPHGERPHGPPPHRRGPEKDEAQPQDPPAAEPEGEAP